MITKSILYKIAEITSFRGGRLEGCPNVFRNIKVFVNASRTEVYDQITGFCFVFSFKNISALQAHKIINHLSFPFRWIRTLIVREMGQGVNLGFLPVIREVRP